MNSRTRKRFVRLMILGVICYLTLMIFWLMDVALIAGDHYSGLMLYGLIFILAIYNLRKRIRFLPIGSSESWLQFHIYVGLFTSVLFGIHVCWQLPSGIIELILAGLYLTTFASGIIGLLISRSFAKRLATRGNEIMFDRIPAALTAVQRDVDGLVMNCLKQTDSSAIPRFYAERLRPFFDRPRHLFQHVIHSNRPRAALLSEIKGFEKYLSESERRTLESISEKVLYKDNLDYHYALQLSLKAWMLVHVPLTYALLVFATIHLLLVLAFSGRIG